MVALKNPIRRPNGYGSYVAHHRSTGAHTASYDAYERMSAQYAAATFVDPGPTNTFMPSWDATGQTIVFLRDPFKFPIRRYAYWRPTDAMVGLYKVLDSTQAYRVVSDAEYDFPDGAERPVQNDNLMGFYDVPFKTNRKWYGWALGDLTRKNCPWQIEAAQSAVTMTQATVNRTNRFVGMMETPTNWGANTADCNVLNAGAGFVDQADTNNYAIRKMVNAVVLAIKRATFGMVRAKDIRMVIGPVAAQLMGQSKEMADYVKNSYWGKAALEGDIFGYIQEFNLPPKLYGVEVVVEDSEIVTSPKGATTAQQFIKDSNIINFAAMVQGLPGDQVGSFAVPNFSTMQWFGYGGEMQVKTFSDQINERVVGGVEENFVEAMPASQSGYCVTNALSIGSTH